MEACKQEGEKRKDKEKEEEREKGGELWEDGEAREGESDVWQGLSLSILHSPHSHLRVLPLRVQHLIVLSSTLLQILPLLGFISRSIGPWLVSGSAFGSQGMPSTLWRWYNWTIFVEAVSLIWMLYAPLARSSPWKTNKKQRRWHTPGKRSPEMLRLISSKYYGIALAIAQTRYVSTLEKIRTCVCMSCAALTRTRNPKIDMIKLAGRRPAKKWPHCTAMEKKIAICVLLCMNACHLAEDA